MIVFILAPLHDDTDLDIGRIRLDEPAAPIKNESDRIRREHHTVIERDVTRFNNSVPIEIHLHPIGVVVHHFDSGHLSRIARMPAHGVDARFFGVAGEQAGGVGQADALSGGRDPENGQSGNYADDGERDDELHHREAVLGRLFFLSGNSGAHHSSGAGTRRISAKLPVVHGATTMPAVDHSQMPRFHAATQRQQSSGCY